MRKRYKKFDDKFYSKLLDYLSEEIYVSLHWNKEYGLLGEDMGTYCWWYEDNDLGRGGFNTKEEVVKDIFSKIKRLVADY